MGMRVDTQMGAPGLAIVRRATLAARAAKPTRLPARLLILLGALLALTLLVAPAASATTYDMRGEWQYSLTCSCGPTIHGIIVVRQMNLATGEFSGTGSLEGVPEGNPSGTVSGESLSLEIPYPYTPAGSTTFKTSHGTIEAAVNEFSGPGEYTNPPGTTGEIKAKLKRSLAAVEKEEQEIAQRAKEQREAKEKQEQEETKTREAQEKAEAEKHAQEAKEKAEAEAREKPVREAKEKAEKEAQEKQAKEKQEAKEREEKQAKEKAEVEKQAREKAEAEKRATEAAVNTQSKPSPADLMNRAATLGGGGAISLKLSNHNGFAISGKITLIEDAAQKSGKAHKPKPVVLGEGSFAISAHGSRLVKVKLTSAGRAALAHGRSLHVSARVATGATGHPTVVKLYTLTVSRVSR
jgi:hypothetical protein